MDNNFKTGFSRKPYTPDFSVPLGGYGNGDKRMSSNVLDDVEVSCIALSDEDGKIFLMYSIDSCAIGGKYMLDAKDNISKETGVPVGNIFMSATHTHSAPGGNVNYDADYSRNLREKCFFPAVIAAAKEAISDLEDTEVFGGRTKCERLNYVRRYKTDKGWGNNTRGGATLLYHETEPDNELQVIRFARKDKKDIILVNWQAHATFNGGELRGDISADYPKYIRETVEEKENVHCIFFQGASGNLVARGKLPGEKPDELNSAELYGTSVAEKAISALKNTEKLTPGKLKAKRTNVELNIDHSKDGEKEKAAEAWNLFKEGKSDEAKNKAYANGFPTIYAARDVIIKSNMPKTGSVYVKAITCGDFAFGLFPYEMFDTNGMQVKSNSPYKMTFICELSDGAFSYIPSSLAFDHGGYEVTSCKYEKGVGEKLADAAIDILNELK